jgi:peptidoglycan/xylan/chitin deacetylase (PgdA/CDA1 family)
VASADACRSAGTLRAKPAGFGLKQLVAALLTLAPRMAEWSLRRDGPGFSAATANHGWQEVPRMKWTLQAGLVSLVRNSGLAVPLRKRLEGCGLILYLHEIQDDPAAELMSGCRPSFLAEIVEGLRRGGWELVTLDEALRRLSNGSAARPFAVLTFDDGYRDNLTRALPVLERLQAPFTVFVPTGAVTRELFAWWLALRALLVARQEIEIGCMGERFSCASLSDKVAAFDAVSRWVAEDRRRTHDLMPTFAAHGLSLEGLAEAYFLSEEELRTLAKHPLVTIGAHTTSHAALPALETEEARAEMADNKAFLENLLDREVLHFAYPYGAGRAARDGREPTLAREIGFASAVTTRTSPVFPRHRDNPHALPRIGVRPHETLGSLYYRASGLSWALKAHKRLRRANG